MPGVIDQTSSGFSREVGKMAFLHDDLSALMNFSSVEEFADKLLEAEELDLLSPPPSSSSSPSRDSELDMLPDYETPVDLLNFMDGNDPLLPGLSCDGDCSLDTKLILKVSTSNKDPFMGHRDDFNEFISSTDSPLGSDAILGQLRDPLLDPSHPLHQHQPIKTEFSAWGHAPTTDDDETVLFPGNGNSSSSTSTAYTDDQDMLPDTPSSYSGTATGDEIESDVDIETIPDTPHSLDICGYSSSDTSSDVSISPTPFKSNNKISILQRYSSHLGHTSSSSSKSLIRFNSCGVSSSVSLAENLMSGRPSVGKKRKHKDKYSVSKSSSNILNSYSTYYPTGNSVNFHDYAMSPSSCMSTETAQPTVLSSNGSNLSKRIYKRKQLNTNDLSDKEKQNHHNQLERNRRQKLADLFIDLRDEVPSITNQSKASKVMILNQATTYIGELQRLYRNQEDVLTKELHRKEFLKKQLKQLESHASRS